jgi:hypothetical protein
MAKKKLKRGVKRLLFTTLFVAITLFCVTYFNLWDKALMYFSNNDGININIKNIYKPVIKNVNVDSKVRTFGVSINNNHDSWPHVGLQDAFLCYELIAEGGITRILAFYKDVSLEKIGSVRSARHYFLDYILENDAIFVHYGHSPQALEDIKSLGIDNINGMYDSAFFRDTSLNKAYEHTAFTSTEKINTYISKKGYRNTSDVMLLTYSPLNIDRSNEEYNTANSVSIEYSDYTTTKYIYDEKNHNYKQYMSNTEQIDGVTNKTYTVKNIITYQVKNSSIDSKGRQNLSNIGSGEGYYISNGKSIKIKWIKDSRSSKTIYKDMNGKDLVVNDGNTWIHIQPTDKKLVIE